MIKREAPQTPNHKSSIINHKFSVYLGFDIGGTKCAALAGTAAGEVLARIEWPSEAARGPEPMLADLTLHGRRLREEYPAAAAIGVSIGGPLNTAEGVIHSPPNLPGWDALPLKMLLEKEFGLPVFVEHDPASCGLAEYTWGKFAGAERLIYLTCGTGFGAGLIFGGKAYHGAEGNSIEIGHVRYAREGPVAFGKCGSVEAYCSGTGVGLLASWKFPSRWGAAPITAKEIAALAAGGDADAQTILALNAEAVGDVCAALADAFFPNVILLGSLARYFGGDWLRAVRRRFEAEAHPRAVRLCRLEEATLANRLQDLSTLAAAMPKRPGSPGLGGYSPIGPQS